MIVEQIDAFKSWLTAVLKPMCEADPAALAKYVLALIKKDKSEEELRKSMVGQLDVFLEGETQAFVDLVFQTLITKEYINTPVIPNANPPNPNVLKTTPKEIPKESKVIIQPSELPNLNEEVNGGAKKELEIKRDRELRKNPDIVEREDRPPRRKSPRHSPSLRNRSPRSRSRSWDRAKRSRSREKSREREQHRLDREKRERQRVWRNKSPPRRYERRRISRTPSPIRIRSRSRSPRHSHRSRYRRTSGSRSRSRSADKRDRRDSLKDKEKEKESSRPGTPTQDSNHGDMDLRLTNSTQSIQSVVVQQGNKKRCRDFDEKGYCMRGEMCPFDHGVDPVVLEDAALTRVLSYNPNGAPAVVTAGGIPAPVLTAPGHPLIGQRHPAPPDHPYNPQAPQIWRVSRFRGPRPIGMARVPPPRSIPANEYES
ncbi:hypothetical protein NQ317_013517 [Molorchus minor]|uniref:C3H1-type domain-containing protein n=1 Tax=Molorchus minor TaxID=1323400 RepID=A0ABQ9JVL2_9CUCU|nr:hypothetical protein NQ317_013517 [Molorchus minor]